MIKLLVEFKIVKHRLFSTQNTQTKTLVELIYRNKILFFCSFEYTRERLVWRWLLL